MANNSLRTVGIPIIGMAAVAAGGYLLFLPTQVPVRAQQAPTAVADFDAKSQAEFKNKVTPLLKNYCYECHGDGESTGGLALDDYQTAEDVNRDPKMWDTVFHYVKSHQMPPFGEPQPTDAERKLVVDWADAQLNHYYQQHPDPGKVTIHRLNKVEYDNSIRDLTGLDIHPADDFPSDDSGYGFDNIADVLSLPPMLMEKYMAAADKVMDQAIPTESFASHVTRIPGSLTEISFYAMGDRGDGWIGLAGNNDHSAYDVMVPQTGEYIIRTLAYGVAANAIVAAGGVPQRITGPHDPVIASIQVGNLIVRNVVLTEDEKNPQVYEAHIVVPAGQQRFQIMARPLRGGDYEDMVANRKVGKDHAGTILTKYIEIEGPLPCSARVYTGAELKSTGLGYNTKGGAHVMTSEGEVSAPIDVSTDADVRFRVKAVATRCGDEPARLEFRVDGNPILDYDVLAPAARVQLPPDPTDNGGGGFGGGPGGGAGGGNQLSKDQLAEIPEMYEAQAKLPPGKHVLSAAFVNPCNDPTNADPNKLARTLTIESFQVADMSKPPLHSPMVQGMRELFQKHGVAEDDRPVAQPKVAFSDLKSQQAIEAARGIISDFALRAWRRPAPANELDRLMQMYSLAADNGETFEGSVKLAMKTVLISPHFLFRGVPMSAHVQAAKPNGNDVMLAVAPPSPDIPKSDESTGSAIKVDAISSAPATRPTTAPATSPSSLIGAEGATDAPMIYSVHPVDEFELASRLSYFLWSTAPDSELLDLAQKGELRKNLSAEVTRLLTAPQASALVENFGGQWLQFRTLDGVAPARQFTDFDPALKAAVQKEPELFFEYVMRQDRSIIDFLDADYTFVNERLATHYGISGVTGEDFQKVSLVGTPRRGILTEAGILMLTSNPTRTSPVKRGKWVLENVLGSPPPPPPPNVPALGVEDEQHPLTGSLRQQMEQHRANPLCASCHSIMDPIGFSLENFGAIGEYRTTEYDGVTKIDSTGQLATGEKFSNAAELTAILASTRKEDFVNCLSEKMLTYALGRGVEYYDHAALGQIVSQVDQNDYRFSSLIQAVVGSVPFQMERGDPITAPASGQ